MATAKIKNFKQLAVTPLRRQALAIIEAGFEAIDTQNVVKQNVSLLNKELVVKGQSFSLRNTKRIFVLGVGKCAIEAAATLEKIFRKYLAGGIIIGLEKPKGLKKIQVFAGTHPFPSKQNVLAAKKLINFLQSLQKNDLVVAVISGGGSTLLCAPKKFGYQNEGKLFQALSQAGADIVEINTVRKHLSFARGGFLAKHVYPAKMISLIFSDVLGDRLDFVASGPTFQDKTTVKDALGVLTKYRLQKRFRLKVADLIETPKEAKYFQSVRNILLVSNKIALEAMARKAKDLGFRSLIKTATLCGEAQSVGREIASLFAKVKPRTALLSGGETTVMISGPGRRGGRNQELALAALPFLKKGQLVLAINTDGWDNSKFAGALCDIITKKKALAKKLNPEKQLAAHDSYNFFRQTGDFLFTGRLGSNVADLILALKN